MNHQDRPSFLMAALGLQTKLRFTELLAPLGIHPRHFGVLRWIDGNDGSTQQEVADLMQLRRSVMVGLVDDLETAGLVTRGRHPADRRAHALHLTTAGRRTLTRADRIADRMDAEVLAPLDPADRHPFTEQLRVMSAPTGISAGIFPEPPRG